MKGYLKRYAIATIASVCLGVAFLLSGAAQAQTTIKLAHPNVPKHPMGQGFEYFKELVENRSDGRFRVQIFDSSQFGDTGSLVQGLQSGLLQMASDSTANLSPFTKDFLLYDLPFLIPSYEAADLITDGPIGVGAAQALSDSGILGLGYIDIGFRHLFNSRHPVETLDDVDGLKIRSTSSKVQIATLKALGMNPTPIAWSEVYTALEQQTVDGVGIDLNLAWFNKFQEVTNNLTLVGAIYSPHLVMISKKFYQGLSPSDQILISEAFTEMKLYERNLIRTNEAMILEKMKTSGLDIVELSDEQRAKWQEATQSVYDQFGDQVGRDLIQRARQTIADHQ